MSLTRHLYERQVFDMSNSYTHLTLQDRIIIAAGISNGSPKAAIADTIGKDKSTVGKEIRLHRFLKYKCRLPLEMAAAGIPDAISINTGTILRTPRRITAQPSRTQEPVST